MTLVDSGPLIAIIDRNDDDHARCVAALANLKGPLVATWPVITEAMHLLGRQTGWAGQNSLWKLLLRGDLLVAELDKPLCERSAELMAQYHDLPMDFADATLVAVAESRRQHHILTIDSDFTVYRLYGRKAFIILP